MSITNKQLEEAVSQTDFSSRFYELCDRYPGHNDISPCNTSSKNVRAILDTIGVDTTGWIPKFRTYEKVEHTDVGTFHAGFTIHYRIGIEFFFWIERPDGIRLGGNLTEIAHYSQLYTGNPTPDPPFPRPSFYDLDSFKGILIEGLLLVDALRQITLSLLNR